MRAIRALAFGTALVGALVLAGWALDSTLLKSGLEGFAATQPLTAACLLLCGLALDLTTRAPSRARRVASVLAALVVAVAALIVAQNAFDADWGSDRWLFADAIASGQTGPFLRAGRPAGAALIALSAAGLALLLVPTSRPAHGHLFVFLATAGVLGALAVLLAYAFGVSLLYVMGLYGHVGLWTGAGFALLFSGLLLRRGDLGWMRHLLGPTRGAVDTRRLLSWTVAVLIVVVGIVQFGTRAAWYRAELEVVLVTLAGIAILFAGLVSHARRIDALDSENQIATQALAATEVRRHQFLATLAHEMRNPLAPLRNGLTLLRLRTAGDEQLKPTIALMERQLAELTRAIDYLIEDYGRDVPSQTPDATEPQRGIPAATRMTRANRLSARPDAGVPGSPPS